MRREQENSIWSELWNALKYCIESRNGKYSLDTYLDIVGEYTDRQIKTAEKGGLKYKGGECQVINSHDKNSYEFEIKMFFEDSNGENIVKEAKKILPKNKFLSETDKEIGETVKFEIKKPN